MSSMSSRMSSRKAALERSAAYKRSAPPTVVRPPVLRITSDDGSTATPLDSPTQQSYDEEDVERANSILGSFPSPPRSERSPSAYYDVTNSDNSRRPSQDDSETYQTFDYRPKVKLGPRPVNLSEKKRRPQTSSTGGRPTSSLPPGFQVKTKQSETTLKPKEPTSMPVDSPMVADVMMTPALPTPPPIPESPLSLIHI